SVIRRAILGHRAAADNIAARFPSFSRSNGNFVDFPDLAAITTRKRRAKSNVCGLIPLAALTGNFSRPKRELNPSNRELRELAAMLRHITAEDQKRTRNKAICKI
ncbi:MAG TPA: hypothetical protein VKB89_25705, partial [Xanthobacteraceae bacterium]|nr:hypothetical protein [Xanthobacteraceae bacterium]